MSTEAFPQTTTRAAVTVEDLEISTSNGTKVVSEVSLRDRAR